MVSKIFETAFRIAFTTSEFTCPVASLPPRLHQVFGHNVAEAKTGPEAFASGLFFLAHPPRDFIAHQSSPLQNRGTHSSADHSLIRLEVL